MNTSYITLLPKKDTDKTQLKNYRPISLLNTDYKILTKTLANKLKPHLNTLIHVNQQCSIKGRDINNHNHLIRDIIQYTSEKQIQTCILSLDQEKAFDRVDHAYLHKILQHNKLGEYFCNWVKILYRTPISNLIINNIISKNIAIKRSVRQGCPLSPYLYILSFEPLLEKIRMEKNITGIGIPGARDIKVIAYADDTVFFPTNDRSIHKIISIFQDFGKGSGSKINVNKSEIMGIGKWQDRLDFPLGIIRKESLRIYGIFYSNNQTQTNTEIWRNIEQSIKQIIDRNKYTAQTIFGRSTIINTYVIPKTIYTGTIWEPPPIILKEINSHITKYIFQGTIHNIKHTTLIQSKLNGGINLQDIQTKIQALRIKFIGQAIKKRSENTFTHYYLGIRIGHLIAIDNSTAHYMGRNQSQFHTACIKAIKGNEEVLHKTTKEIYTHLIKRQATPLNNRIKWTQVYGITNTEETFKNTHIKEIPNKEKEITYRLIYNTTPVSSRNYKDRGARIGCPLCRPGADETEQHLYLTCNTILQTKNTLQQFIQAGTIHKVDIDKAITLNIIPDSINKKQQTISLKNTFTVQKTHMASQTYGILP